MVMDRSVIDAILARYPALMRVDQVALELQVTSRTVYRWIAEDRLQVCGTGGRVRVLKESVVTLMVEGLPGERQRVTQRRPGRNWATGWR